MKIPVPKINPAALTGKLKGIVPALRARLPAKLGGTGEPAEDPYAGIPPHLRPTFLQRNVHLLPVVGAYVVLFLIATGIGTYLFLNGDSIREELEAQVPRLEITQFTFVDKTTGGEPDAPATTEEPQDTAQPDGDQTEPDQSQPDQTDVATTETTAPPLPSLDEPDPYAGNLAPHPDPGLTEEVPSIGNLPRIGDDGRLPWKVYARPSSSLETRPRISVVILNLGLSEKTTTAAINLPGAVTLAFSPYAPRLEEWIDQARAAGHEVMVGLPMEPRDFPRSDAGILALMTAVEPEQNILNLNRILSEGSGYIGLVNQQGTGFTANRAAMQPIMQALGERGLVYFDTLENATSVAEEIAARTGTPHTVGDMLLDSTLSPSMVIARLSHLELLAKNRKSAVVAVQPFPMLMSRIAAWSRDLPGKSMVLTPLSGVITARSREG